MQPRNGEETKYFFIVSQYSRGRLVLDIKNGKKVVFLRSWNQNADDQVSCGDGMRVVG